MSKISRDWWYRVWYRGYSGRVHKVHGKRRRFGEHLIDKDGWGLPPAIRRHIVKLKKVRLVKKAER